MATNISFSTYGFMNGILILSEENWRTFFKPFITDSVQNGLATIAGANMTVYVSAGECRCGAVMGILDEMIALDIANGDSTYDRIDSVIVQYTYGEPSTLAVAIIQGTPSTNPVPPTLTKVYDTLWQMEIAQILVPSGATSSSEFTITDKRVIYESIESIIDDNIESEERVWSSQKSREEIVSLSTEIYDSLNTKADVIERTVSGDIVTITDGGNNLPVKELVVDIEPVQDLHGYDNPFPPDGHPNDYTGQYTLASNLYLIPDNDHRVYSKTLNPQRSIIMPCSSSTQYRVRSGIAGTMRVGSFTTSPSSGSIPNVFETATDNSNPVQLLITTGANDKYLFIQFFIDGDVTDRGATFEGAIGGFYYAPYSNICPISGWSSATVTRTGKNLLPNLKVRSGTTRVVIGQSESYDTRKLFLPIGTYKLSVTLDSGTGNLYYRGPDNNTNRKLSEGLIGTLTVTKAGTFVFWVYKSDGLNVDNVLSFQLELGSTATPYKSYQGQTVTINLGEERYGGTLDVLTGVLTVTSGIVTINGSTGSWWKRSNTTYPSYYVTNSSLGINIIEADGWITDGVYCDTFAVTKGGGYSGVATGKMSINHSQTFFCIDVGTTTTDFKTWLSSNPVTIVYPLATPLTVQLSPSQMSTILGTNHLWANAGDILNLTYRTDTKKYIEQKVADTNRKTCEIMTIVTDEMIAPNNLVIGDLVIVNDDLYKATANIASGATLTVGTNVQKLTLAEYIQSLL